MNSPGPEPASPVSTFVLDAGVLIAVDRGSRDLLSTLQAAFENGDRVLAPTGAIGQAWRDPNRQVLLSRALKRCDEVALDGSAARASGRLCGRAGTSDLIDASVAVTVANATLRHGDVVFLTSDSRDMNELLSALDTDARVVAV